MTRTATAVGRSGRARTVRAAKRAVQEATRAAQIQAWQDERARRLREEEATRAAGIAARESAIRDNTVDYLLAVAAGEEVMAAARRRYEEFRAQAATAVARLRAQGLSRADLTAVTGLAPREVTALLDSAAQVEDGPAAGKPGEDPAGDDTTDGGNEVRGARQDVSGPAAGSGTREDPERVADGDSGSTAAPGDRQTAGGAVADGRERDAAGVERDRADGAGTAVSDGPVQPPGPRWTGTR